MVPVDIHSVGVNSPVVPSHGTVSQRSTALNIYDHTIRHEARTEIFPVLFSSLEDEAGVGRLTRDFGNYHVGRVEVVLHPVVVGLGLDVGISATVPCEVD
jgi:hypothetical protein